MDTLEQLNSIFCKVFDNNDIKITLETTANDIEEWDSLSHINLVVAIEKHFKIKFKDSEIIRWKNVGQMYESIVVNIEQK
jgi:acyl carrier protein